VAERVFTGVRLEDIWHIDIEKERLAKENGYHLIVLLCLTSDYETLREEIENSELSQLFDLSQVDWLQCQVDAIPEMTMKAAKLWNNGMRSTVQIARYLGMTKTPVRNYLMQCAELGLCDYTPEEGRANCKTNIKKALSKSVTLLNTGEVFVSAVEAGKKYGANSSHISQVCKRKRFYAGKFNNQPLIWRYADEVQGGDIDHMLEEGLQQVSLSIQKNQDSIRRNRAAKREKRLMQKAG
jgi:hypothetical protein